MAKLLKGEVLAKVDLALLNAVATGFTLDDIAEQTGVGRRTVARRKKELIDRGSLTPSKKETPTKTPTRKKSASQRAPGTLESILEEASTGDIATPEESMRILSAITRNPEISAHPRAIAMKHLNDLRTQHAPKDSLGPAPPLTREDKIDRLSSLMDCCGKNVTLAAMEKQWPPSSISPSSSEESSPGESSSGGPDPCSSSGADASSPSSSPTEPLGDHTDTPPSGDNPNQDPQPS